MGTAEASPGDEHALREQDVGKDRAQGKAHAEDSVWRSVILSNANYLASLLAALTINLALPLVMSKNQFADVRTFLLFAGFGGLLHGGCSMVSFCPSSGLDSRTSRSDSFDRSAGSSSPSSWQPSAR